MSKRKPNTRLGWSPETAEREIIAASRKLTSLQAKRRKALKALKLIDDDIKSAKKALRVIVQQVTVDNDPMMPPLQAFGERQGD